MFVCDYVVVVTPSFRFVRITDPATMPVTPHQSLVKYLPPTLVHFTKDTGKGGSKKKKKLPPVTDKKATQTEDILNSILPPREWTDDGQLWVQYVSSTPATRVDVIGLQELLDQRLQQRQARETGICPIREELYAQCFGACCVRFACLLFAARAGSIWVEQVRAPPSRLHSDKLGRRIEVGPT